MHQETPGHQTYNDVLLISATWSNSSAWIMSGVTVRTAVPPVRPIPSENGENWRTTEVETWSGKLICYS